MSRKAPRYTKRKHVTAGPMRPNPGSAPGLLSRNPLSHPTQLMVIGYGPEGYVEHVCEGLGDIDKFIGSWPVTWVNVSGLADIEMIEHLGNMFHLDRLSLEDVLDSSSRTKVEFHEHYVFTVMKGGVHGEQFESEQISLFLKKNVVISFQEKTNYSFEQVRDRVRRGTGKIRHMGTDYLYYALIDEVIDRYFPILDHFNTQLSLIEEKMVVTAGEDKDVIQQIHNVKTDLLLLHRTIWPMSDLMGQLMREDTPLITKSTNNFLRDCLDHSIQANELTQFYRDTASGLLNTFLAYEGHKTNEIVRILTMVSVAFMPLNLIAGIYGMNFDNIPEMHWEYGYLFAMGLMLSVGLLMLVFFIHKGWMHIGRRKPLPLFSDPAEKKPNP